MIQNCIDHCKLAQLPKITKRAGNITPLENSVDIPFDVSRVYYLYDIPAGINRGGPRPQKLQQLIIAVSGAFNVKIDDGKNSKIITLNRPNYALYLVSGIWRELIDFSSGAICLVLASDTFDENDYIRDYKKFLEYKKKL